MGEKTDYSQEEMVRGRVWKTDGIPPHTSSTAHIQERSIFNDYIAYLNKGGRKTNLKLSFFFHSAPLNILISPVNSICFNFHHETCSHHKPLKVRDWRENLSP